MPTTYSISDLMARHEKRFAQTLDYAKSEAGQAGLDLLNEIRSLDNGQPQGSGRAQALRDVGFPYAARRGYPLWATPPVGVISGRLIASLQVVANFGNDVFGVVAKSLGVDYAQFIYSPDGTSKMVARGVLQAANDFSTARALKLGRDTMAFQLRLL